MGKGNKDNLKTTIAGVVAAAEANQPDGKSFFRKPDVPEGEKIPAVADVSSVQILDLLRNADMLVPGGTLGPEFFDEYRRIKRPLLSNAYGKTATLVDRGNLILVTSSGPSEGKTFTAVNLALSIAQERDHTVLLADCDANMKGVSQMLGLGERAGLIDVLENEHLGIGDVLLRTDIPQLSVLCAGKQHEFMTELLASNRMIDVIEEMASRYNDRIIVLDGPPLLSTPQTHVLAALVGQVVIVVESGKTQQSMLDEALELIPEDKAVGLVLNKSENIAGSGGLYYGYSGYGRSNADE